MAQLIWLVINATSGFGEAFVRDLLERGDKVIAAASHKSEGLLNLERAGAAIVEFDLNQSSYRLSRRLDELLSIYDGLDVLVINKNLTHSQARQGFGGIFPAIEETTKHGRCISDAACRYFNFVGSGLFIHMVSTLYKSLETVDGKETEVLVNSHESTSAKQTKAKDQDLLSGVQFCSVAPGCFPCTDDEYDVAIGTGLGPLLLPRRLLPTSSIAPCKIRNELAESSLTSTHGSAILPATDRREKLSTLHKMYLSLMTEVSSRWSREESLDSGETSSFKSEPLSLKDDSSTESSAPSQDELSKPAAHPMHTSTSVKEATFPITQTSHAPSKASSIPPLSAMSSADDNQGYFIIPPGVDGVAIIRTQCVEKLAICEKWSNGGEPKLPLGMEAMMRMCPEWGDLKGDNLRQFLLDD